ncbi:TIGR04141 family sporadically distributed protein [Sporosarcina saromensis]|uniref:TIGR04141 family sporadically distributed protein n=1 Tax=Sporosarcina saromensis TaxID=359365 RepID=A0ABU4GDL0_9BACL|nr:DUF6119 family protein [Sporosarcina saromensis]MDW0115069.1 TIGR04141 family sporadically distributed protein [Sporosarcina saromensis]
MNTLVNNFTIYLLEKKLPFNNYITDQANVIHNKQLNKKMFIQTDSLEIEAGKVVILEKKIASPDWLDLLNNVIVQKESLDFEIRKDWSAILFLRLKEVNNTVAVTFGRMNGILEEKLVINDFGLITSKQIVDSSRIKFIKIQSFDEKQTKINKQSMRLLNDFKIMPSFEPSTIKGFNGNTQLLNRSLDIGGRSGLRINGKLDIRKHLLSLLEEILKAYFSHGIKEPRFKILDTVNIVSDSHVLKKLNEEFQKKLEIIFSGAKIDHNKMRNLSLVPNCDIPYENLKGFHITGIGMPTTSVYKELELIEIFEKVKLKISKHPSQDEIMKKLRNTRINCKSENSENDQFVSLYNSLCFEKTTAGVRYILSEGTWYSLNDDFYKQITETIDKVPITPVINYIDYDVKIHKDENKYNENLILKTNTIGLDCTKYKPTEEILKRSSISSQSNIELADVFKQEGDTIHFIHIKKRQTPAKPIIF